MLLYPRRSFIARLGLGAGAALLAPLVTSLVREADGATPNEKRILFFVRGEGVHPGLVTPSEHLSSVSSWTRVDAEPGTFGWRECFEPLSKYQERCLLIDGLTCRVPTENHSTRYGALTCRRLEDQGPSIDQFLAPVMSDGLPWRSINSGVDCCGASECSSVFATGPNQRVYTPARADHMYNSLFGDIVNGSSEVQVRADRHLRLVDAMRADLARVRSSMGSAERPKLDQYVDAIDQFDQRNRLVTGLECPSPTAPPEGTSGDAEVTLQHMGEMIAIAMSCGMTAVAGLQSGAGNQHNGVVYRQIATGTPFEGVGVSMAGHGGPEDKNSQCPLMFKADFQIIARFLDAMDAVGRLDQTYVVYLSDNGTDHHDGSHDRFPLLVIGGGALRTGGRFVRFERLEHSLGEFFCSLAHACGVPTDDFGRGGVEEVNGPIEELLT